MKLSHIECFIVVCEQGSLTNAATILDVSQSTISRQIQLLEAELRQHLLVRNGHGVTPNEQGLKFLSYAKQINKICHQIKTEFSQHPQSLYGTIRLGLPPRIARRLVPCIVNEFLIKLPNIKLTIEEALSQNLREMLISSQLDIALLFDQTPSDAITNSVIYEEELVLAYSEKSNPKPAASIKFSELKKYPMLLPNKSNVLRRVIELACKDRGISLKIHAEVGVIQSIIETISASNLYTLIPASELKTAPNSQPVFHSKISDHSIKNKLSIATPTSLWNNHLTNESIKLIQNIDFNSALGFQPNTNI